MTHASPTERPDDRRVQRTHAAIADAVRALFADEGWDAVTHQRVAEHAGYGRNTVYRHFPDRTSLLAHGGNFGDVHHAAVTGDLRVDLVAELQSFRRELFDGIVGRIIAAMVERADRDPEIEPMRDQLVAAGSRQTATLVEQAIVATRMSAGISVADHVANLCGPLVFARLCQSRRPDNAAIEHLVDQHLAPAESTSTYPIKPSP